MAYPSDDPTAGDASPALTDGQAAKEFSRVSLTLKTLSDGNRTLLRASDEQELLHDMCRVIVETGGYRFAWVAYLEHNELKSIRWMAGVGMDKERSKAFHFNWAEDMESGGTAIGTAIRTGEPVVGRNLTDLGLAGPTYDRFREDAIQKGYASVTAFPLRVDGEVLGALAIAAAELDAFGAGEVNLLSQLADDLAYGIANLRTRVQHREAQAALERLAYYDPLTDLPNRTQLLEGLQGKIETAKQQHRALALLHLQVGQFHEINKVLGYSSGDKLLQVRPSLSRRGAIPI